jgi:Raf kinase inhibitor-like YbhB/YbcL family protein
MLTEVITDLGISSPVFENNGFLPVEFSCEGGENSPPIQIDGIPDTARTLVLIVEDPDASGKVFDHWVVFNIAPVNFIDKNTIPGIIGKNSKGENKYHGPCPPSGTHHYHFKVYALNALLYLTEDATKHDVVTAMESHIVAAGEMIGLYGKC